MLKLRIDAVLEYMNIKMKEIFNMIDADILIRINEIRIKRGGYLRLVIRNSTYFTDCNGDLYDSVSQHCVKVSDAEFDELFMALCSYSFHTHSETLKYGYLTLENGIRIGVAGEAVFEENRLISVKNITSLNIRIPCDEQGYAEEVVREIYTGSLPSVIVAGMPNSGKTTLLRGIARQLSEGASGRYLKVCVIDERRELNTQNALANADVLSSYPKKLGIEIASRTFSPELIVCDEIGTPEEAESVKSGFACGCAFALSLHIGDRSQLYRKPVLRSLLETGEFSFVILMQDYTYKPLIIKAPEVLNEICGNSSNPYVNDGRGNILFT